MLQKPRQLRSGSPLAVLCDLAFLIYFSCQSMLESTSLETTSTKVCLNGNLLLSRWRMKTALIDIGKLILTWVNSRSEGQANPCKILTFSKSYKFFPFFTVAIFSKWWRWKQQFGWQFRGSHDYGSSIKGWITAYCNKNMSGHLH